jgi:hypothetical protein
VASNTDKDGQIARDSLSHELADFMGKERSEFDRARFLKACGVKR